MRIKTPVGNRNQVSIEATLIPPRLIAGYKNDRVAIWIESESGSPLALRRLEPELLHIGMPRASQSVCVGPAETWAIPPQPLDLRREFKPDLLREVSKLPFEVGVKFNAPYHCVPFYTLRHASGVYKIPD